MRRTGATSAGESSVALRRAFCIDHAFDDEARIVEARTGKGPMELSKVCGAVVITRGPEGSTVYTGGQQIAIPAVRPDAVIDPTGCGDAYRAGLLYGLSRDWDWVKSAKLASLLGAIKIAHRGGQNHGPDRAEIAERFHKAFGETL